jgi:hypothetical protein
MKTLPKYIIRITDNERFILNENGKYELEMMQEFKKKGHIVNEYDCDVLMNTYKGLFIPENDA